MAERIYSLGSDIGGTFTDVAVVDQQTGELYLGKRLTRVGAEHEGIAHAVAATGVPLDRVDVAFHGTTLVINALLQRRGSKAALLTTAGFEDIIFMGRGNRPEIFNPFYARHAPLVTPDLVYGVTGRIDAAGTVVTELDEAGVVALAGTLREQGVESVAICFLNAYVNPAHEQRARELLHRELPGVLVTISSELSGEWREYERSCTTLANAYVAPKVDAYLGSVEGRLRADGFGGALYVLHSAGGALPLEAARAQPIRMVESGPAGGVIGAEHLARSLGLGDVVFFDMGGTTAKSVAIEGNQFQTRDDYWIGGYARGFPVQIPTVDIVEVGAGGGSIAWLENGTRLRVGPISAGALPGPACYDLGGTEPTVTDANVFCGRIQPDFFVGEITLNPEAARKAISDLAQRAGLEPGRLALGILELANLEMATSVRRQTLERGRDPSGYTLIASGGAGPGHACDVAAEVGIRRVLIPPHPGHFSALGMAASQLKAEHRVTIQAALSSVDCDEVNRQLRPIRMELRQRLGSGPDDPASSTRLWAYLRYQGQEHRLKILVSDQGEGELVPAELPALERRFEAEYQANFGRSYPGAGVELVGFEVECLRRVNAVDSFGTGGKADGLAPLGEREVLFNDRQGGRQLTPIFPRGQVEARVGPAIIFEPGSVTVVPPGWTIEQVEGGSILLEREK